MPRSPARVALAPALALALPLALALALALGSRAAAQDAPDPGLVAAIARIRAFDDHSHVMTVVGPGERPDSEYDALPVDGMQPFSLPVRMSPQNLEFVGAWKALYGYPYADMAPAHLAWLRAARGRVLREHGDGFPAWVLDRVGIETMVGNRIAMGRGLTPPRFLWVPYDDALLFPVSTESIRRRNGDTRHFYAGEEKLLRRYLRDLGVEALPAMLDEYVARVVGPTLQRQARGGALAVKFEAAYLRALDFEPASADEAGRIYAQYVRGDDPDAAQVKTLADYLFRAIARQAGALHMAVHFHTGIGAGAYFDLGGSNPMNLESALDDTALAGTSFVLLHGGWPFTKETAALVGKHNVWADFSFQDQMLPAPQLAAVLRTWLEMYPDKVMFGTDAFEYSPDVSWPETAWLATTNARRALALALTEMVRAGEVDRTRAVALARMILRDNARRLYALDRAPPRKAVP